MPINRCIYEMRTEAYTAATCTETPEPIRCSANADVAMIRGDDLVWLCNGHVRQWLTGQQLTLEDVLQ